jgi:hypothetical protein
MLSPLFPAHNQSQHFEITISRLFLFDVMIFPYMYIIWERKWICSLIKNKHYNIKYIRSTLSDIKSDSNFNGSKCHQDSFKTFNSNNPKSWLNKFANGDKYLIIFVLLFNIKVIHTGKIHIPITGSMASSASLMVKKERSSNSEGSRDRQFTHRLLDRWGDCHVEVWKGF